MKFTIDAERAICSQFIKSGMPLPKELQNVPEVAPGNEIFWDALADLSSSRKQGEPITWFMIADYCRYNGFSEELTEEMHQVIRELDMVIMKG